MERNISLHINETILHNTFQYAESKGMDFSAVIESFLIRMLTVNEKDKVKNFPISDKVRSLANRIKPNITLLDDKTVFKRKVRVKKIQLDTNID